MSSAASAATSTGSPRPELQAANTSARLTRALSWAAAVGIGGAILIMIVASAVQYSPAVPPPPWSSGLPLLEIPGHLPVAATYAALWAAVVLGGGASSPGWLRAFSPAIWFTWAPFVLLAAVVAVVLLCVSRAWNVRPRLAGWSPGAPALG